TSAEGRARATVRACLPSPVPMSTTSAEYGTRSSAKAAAPTSSVAFPTTLRMGPYPRPVRLVGRGHGAIRATHGKTLEFSADPEIGERATCIVAVATEVTDGRRYAGWIRVRITAGDQEFAFDALANPSWQPDGTAVVRRSGV